MQTLGIYLYIYIYIYPIYIVSIEICDLIENNEEWLFDSDKYIFLDKALNWGKVSFLWMV